MNHKHKSLLEQDAENIDEAQVPKTKMADLQDKDHRKTNINVILRFKFNVICSFCF
jgi:hypothetical protein